MARLVLVQITIVLALAGCGTAATTGNGSISTVPGVAAPTVNPDPEVIDALRIPADGSVIVVGHAIYGISQKKVDAVLHDGKHDGYTPVWKVSDDTP
jgi:hypothetical protein